MAGFDDLIDQSRVWIFGSRLADRSGRLDKRQAAGQRNHRSDSHGLRLSANQNVPHGEANQHDYSNDYRRPNPSLCPVSDGKG